MSNSVVRLQERLSAAGYDVAVDGDMGPRTERALAAYMHELEERPLPPKPAWKTRRMRGLLTLIVGLACMLVPMLRDVDQHQLVELIWGSLDHVQALIVAGGALLAVGGKIWETVGAVQATAPVELTRPRQVGAPQPAPRVPRTAPQDPRNRANHFMDPEI